MKRGAGKYLNHRGTEGTENEEEGTKGSERT
jgi:hypothetical protein